MQFAAERIFTVQADQRRLSRMRTDIVAGAGFPDYELADHTGKRRKLSDLQGSDPMILVLSRGGFCPKDRRQAEGLVRLHHEMEVGYSRLVTSRHRRVHRSRAQSDDPSCRRIKRSNEPRRRRGTHSS